MVKLIIEDLRNSLENVIELFDGDYEKSVSVDLSLMEFQILKKMCDLHLKLKDILGE